MKENKKQGIAPMQWRSTEDKPQDGQLIVEALWGPLAGCYIYLVDYYRSGGLNDGYGFEGVEAWMPLIEYEPTITSEP